MKSQYSIRLYELLKSYEHKNNLTIGIEEVKRMLSAEIYNRHQDFRRKVIELAIKEINALTDIAVAYEFIKEGRKYAKVAFYIRLKKDLDERMHAWGKIDEALNPDQISLFSVLNAQEAMPDD
jgi:plasmid replication initiation protein